jgi:hypothetical protein
MVFTATRITSTLLNPSAQRLMAFTILFTSTDSTDPLRLRTCIPVSPVVGVPQLSSNDGCVAAVSFVSSVVIPFGKTRRDNSIPPRVQVGRAIRGRQQAAESFCHKPCGSPARVLVSDARGGADHRQVIGLTGPKTHQNIRSFPCLVSRCFYREFVSCSPLRGSSGFTPEFLFRRSKFSRANRQLRPSI